MIKDHRNLTEISRQLITEGGRGEKKESLHAQDLNLQLVMIRGQMPYQLAYVRKVTIADLHRYGYLVEYIN